MSEQVSWESEGYVADVAEPTDDRPLWEGVVGAGEHRTVGPHRAYCMVEGEWCYPDLLCRCCIENKGAALLTDDDMQAIRALIEAAWSLAHDILTPEGYCYCGGNVFRGGHTVGCQLDVALDALNHPAIKRLAEEGR